MSSLIYLAYGSNLHPLRLRERVPSAQVLGPVRLPRYALRFHKRSEDRSGKCDLVCVDQPVEAFGALYQIDPAHKHLLDEVEGVGNGYELVTIACELAGRRLEAFAYAASDTHIDRKLNPYHWYKALVVAGARYHNLAPHYVQALETVEAMADPNRAREALNQSLLRRIAQYSPA